eukprot:gb/GFBE01070875.1/.p1 GENE.gb/GFBE01070875.1/~~gb/GFBE01070875.1/.p1  ORF type:complete len:315 (+),score=55.98 gb/GFBE01070875.1/:1-945(+)
MMAAAMQKRGSARPSSTQVAIAAALGACLLVAAAGDAFVTPASARNGAASSVILAKASPAQLGAAKPALPAAESSQSSLFKVAASVALLCAAASQSARSKAPKAQSVRRTAVVGFNYAAPTTSPSIAQQTKLVDMPQQEERIETVTHLVDTASMPAVTVPEMEPASFVQTGATSLGAVAAPAAVPEISATPRALPRSARFVGGARHGSHHRTRAASATRSARRAVGSRLQAYVEPVPVAPLSFDASVSRQKIQIGLRVASCMRSEASRESKMSAGIEGSDMSTCLNFVAHDLRVYTNFRKKVLNDAHHPLLLVA